MHARFIEIHQVFANENVRMVNICCVVDRKIYKTIILPVALYGCETWSLTLREDRRLRVFENRILRRIFGSKRDENGEWRRLHNEEVSSLYRSHNIVRMI